jgi:type I restriction enzyme S subunit
MADWKILKIKDVCEHVTVGFVGTMADQYVESGIPFLRSQNIKPFQVDLENMKYISQAFHHKLRKSSLKPGDIAVVRTGYPGTACVIPASLGEANCSDLVLVRPGANLNPHFLCAIFNSTFGKQLVSGNLVGAAQQHFNITVVKELKLKFPPRTVQDRIASILTAYDDLIENNKRRISILEKMAEEIYREWFVRMRFSSDASDFAKATSDKKALEGKPAFNQDGLPLGWQRLPSDQVFRVLGGGTPKTEVTTYWNGDIPFFTPKDAPEGIYVNDTEKTITEDGLRSCSSDLFPRHSLFITARGTVGKLALAQRPMAMNQSCYALRQKAQSQGVYFYYLAMKDALAYVKGISKSGVFDNIIIDTFKNVPIVLPTDAVIAAFNGIAAPIFGLVENLIDSNRNLIKTRDLLLPRLISGKLSVEDLELPSNEKPTAVSSALPQQEPAHA